MLKYFRRTEGGVPDIDFASLIKENPSELPTEVGGGGDIKPPNNRDVMAAAPAAPEDESNKNSEEDENLENAS